MSMRVLWVMALMSVASAAMAQRVPATTVGDRWSPAPVAAASTAPLGRSAVALPGDEGPASHFKFKTRRDYRPIRNAAQEQSGKASVMGGGQIGPDGRPSVNCAATPMDPACH